MSQDDKVHCLTGLCGKIEKVARLTVTETATIANLTATSLTGTTLTLTNVTISGREASKKLIQFPGLTGNGASAASTISAVIPFDNWRVVALGAASVVGQANTVAETLSFGMSVSDFGNADLDYFGTFSFDVTSGKNLAAGDQIMKVDTAITTLVAVDAAANAGTHAYSAGNPDGFNTWQTKQGVISMTKNNVGSSTATFAGWALIEVK